jgi:uncharacterized short protein YbdD (DUF466 family)
MLTLRHLRDAYHRLFGIPDYQAYVQHMRERHPGKACLSRREFVSGAIDHKYSRRGQRCC